MAMITAYAAMVVLLATVAEPDRPHGEVENAELRAENLKLREQLRVLVGGHPRRLSEAAHDAASITIGECALSSVPGSGTLSSNCLRSLAADGPLSTGSTATLQIGDCALQNVRGESTLRTDCTIDEPPPRAPHVLSPPVPPLAPPSSPAPWVLGVTGTVSYQYPGYEAGSTAFDGGPPMLRDLLTCPTGGDWTARSADERCVGDGSNMCFVGTFHPPIRYSTLLVAYGNTGGGTLYLNGSPVTASGTYNAWHMYYYMSTPGALTSIGINDSPIQKIMELLIDGNRLGCSGLYGGDWTKP